MRKNLILTSLFALASFVLHHHGAHAHDLMPFGFMIGAVNGVPDMQTGQATGADATPGGIIRSQFKRQLPQQTWVSGGSSSVAVPVDDVYKRAFFRINGSFSVTYASGSPVIGGLGIFPKLVTNIVIQQNGQDTLKNVDPYFMRMFDFLVNGELPRRSLTKQAGVFSTRIPLTELENGGSAFQATTGYMLVEECISVYFEHPLAYEHGKAASLWNCRGLASAQIVLQYGQYSNLDESNAGTITFAADLPITIDIELESAPAVSRKQDFLIFKQTSQTASYSGQQTGALIALPRGNLLTGVHMLVREGDANGRRLADHVVTDIEVVLNGQRSIKKTTFRNAQEEMKIAFGLRDIRGTAAQGITHNLQGYCYLGFIRDGVVNTALDTSLQAGVDSVNLKVSTGPSSGTDAVTYTNSILISVMTDELAPPVSRFA
jgi:hypothetical protein